MFSTGLAELVLIVNDVRAAARFYRDGEPSEHCWYGKPFYIGQRGEVPDA